MASTSTPSTSSCVPEVIDLETDEFVIDLEVEEEEKQKKKVEREIRMREVEEKKRVFFSQIGTIIGHRFEPVHLTCPTKWKYQFLAEFKVKQSQEIPAPSFSEYIHDCKRHLHGKTIDWMSNLSNFALFQMSNSPPTTNKSSSTNKSSTISHQIADLANFEDIDEYEVLLVKKLADKKSPKVTVQWAPVWLSAVDAVRCIPHLVEQYMTAVEPSMGRFFMSQPIDPSKPTAELPFEGQSIGPFETKHGLLDPANPGLELLVASVDTKSVHLCAQPDNTPIGPPPLIVASKWGLE